LETGKYSKASLIHVLQKRSKNMNENNIPQAAIEAERKALDTVINLLLLFLLALVGYSVGYYVASMEAAALVKTILN
jgi:hypothetical protein